MQAIMRRNAANAGAILRLYGIAAVRRRIATSHRSFALAQLITRPHAAALLGISPATLAGWACRFPDRPPRVVKIGAAARYRLADVEALIRGETPAATTPDAERAA